MTPISTPVHLIQGIGPSRASRLNTISIFHIFDLLRNRPSDIHRVVKSDTSLDQVHQWQSMSALLLIESMTPQWSEALVKAGIDSYDELMVQSLTSLKACFESALQNHIIQTAPPDDQVIKMITEASVLAHTGFLKGSILDKNGAPLEGISARIGNSECISDKNGRFILSHIKLGRNSPLTLSHSAYQTLIQEAPQVTLSYKTLSLPEFRLTVASSSEPSDLSELRGDKVPVPDGITLREQTLSESDLEDTDILMLYSFYKSSPDVKLLSRFKHFENGQFWVKAYRIPLNLLPEKGEKGQHYIYQNKTFRKFSNSPHSLHREIIRRNFLKTCTPFQPQTSLEQRKETIAKNFRSLNKTGYFRGKSTHV